MRWGRVRQTAQESEGVPIVRASNAAAVIGSIVCVLFFCFFSGGTERETYYPADASQAAISTFLSGHTTLADALGLNAYFPGESVSVGSFSDRGEEAYRAFREEGVKDWTFWDYLCDAFRTLLDPP